MMNGEARFIPKRQRHRPMVLPQHFSEEEMVRDWTLSEDDLEEIRKYRKSFRLHIALQLCAMRLYGRFLNEIHDVSPRILNYFNAQLGLPPSLALQVSGRIATLKEHRKNILKYLEFHKFNEVLQTKLQIWLQQQAQQCILPNDLYQQAERYLLSHRIALPGPSVLERLVTLVCSTTHAKFFESIYQQLSPELKQAIDGLLTIAEGEQRSYFYQLKKYPPSAKISSLKSYLMRYCTLSETGIDVFESHIIEPAFLDYLFKLAKCYSAKGLKRFKEHKRYALMVCFLLETRKVLLDHLVKMHDQYVMDMCRHSKNAHEKKHREFRKRQKRAIDTVLDTTCALFDWPEDQPLYKSELWQKVGEKKLRESIEDLYIFKRIEERGYGDLLLARYPSMRKYFAQFIHLPFAVEQGSNELIKAINIIRKLDSGELKQLPKNAPTAFVPRELRRALKDKAGNINRNAWEMGLALTIKDALRSGDLYLPQSKQHVSFWNLILSESRWKEMRESSYIELQQVQQYEIKATLTQQFHQSAALAEERFYIDNFAEIQDGRLKLKRDDKMALPVSVTNLQKAIDASMPSIRIEQLLIEVDQLTGFSRHFTPIQDHQSRPNHFYKTLDRGQT